MQPAWSASARPSRPDWHSTAPGYPRSGLFAPSGVWSWLPWPARPAQLCLSLRLPVLLDGYAVAAAAVAAAQLDPLAGEGMIATHRSAEPGHDLLLTELGLEPLLDLRLRLGEASGALLALPLIERAGALHRRMGTFEESGVDRAS
jgi:hypothetical protein